MPQLGNNETMGLSSGRWSVTANMGSGTAVLQMSVRGGPFFAIDGTSFSVTGGGLITVPRCTVKAIVTGDAVFELDKVRNR